MEGHSLEGPIDKNAGRNTLNRLEKLSGQSENIQIFLYAVLVKSDIQTFKRFHSNNNNM
jgi:hypothetical protein